MSWRRLEILKTPRGLLLEGTQDWATPAPPDLIAHDIFHHDPEDQGRFVDELMSFGAECWIEHHTDEIAFGVHPESLVAVLETNLASCQIEALEQAPEHEAIPAAFLVRFREIAEQAFTEFSMTDESMVIDDKDMARLCSDEHLDKCAAWMAYGFHRASLRFPDPGKAYDLFNHVHSALAKWKNLGEESLVLHLDEANCQLATDHEQVRHWLTARGCEVRRLQTRLRL